MKFVFIFVYSSVGNAELQERHAFHNFFIIRTFRVKKNWEENFEIITLISSVKIRHNSATN